jgi:hypothetical protein
MVHKAQYDDDTMYNAWVAHNKNASATARALGMEATTMQWHVRKKNFEHRFMVEFGGLAEETMRGGIVKAMLAVPTMVDHLVTMATEDHIVADQYGVPRADPRIMMAKVKAIEALAKYIPQVPEKMSDVFDASLEAVGSVVEQGLSVEDEVKLAIEANIIDAADARTRTWGKK